MGGPPALDGTTVIELTTGIPGAYCGRLLAMLGADVVKVEAPDRPDQARAAGTGADRFLHAQKRSIALDVATPRGDEMLRRLAAGADVVLDDGALGRPPDVTARYDELLAASPQLVLAAFSPFGLDGPKAGWQSRPSWSSWPPVGTSRPARTARRRSCPARRAPTAAPGRSAHSAWCWH